MIILGIDPGFARLGFGVIEETSGKAQAVTYGCFETSSKLERPERLLKIYKEMQRLIKKYKPKKVAFEYLFFSKNTKTAMAVGEARGVIILACAEAKIPPVEIMPNQIKQAVTGYGRADKQQMQKMVKLILGLKEIPKPDDAADALAIALCAARLKNYL